MKDLKYLSAYSIPIVAILGIALKGAWLYATPIYAFVIIPIFEILLPQDDSNLSQGERDNKLKKRVFDWLLYLNVPLVFGILAFGLLTVTQAELATYELVGLIVSVGIVLGSNGINVAHELGHRDTGYERFMGKLLLLPSHYMHFYVEHNFGHHLKAATKEDPATAGYNQSVYSFYVTSVFRQYFSAWKIQRSLLKRAGKGFFSIKNDMLWYTVFQTLYMAVVFTFFGPLGLLLAFAAGVLGFLLLETINYIEHYGLLRLKTKSGRYERVREIHSWNSNHVLGRIMLYELTRHSDHHYKSNKKYQILEYHDTSPQMPFGYPTSMVMSLIPPLWFAVMNKRIPKEMIAAA